MEMEARKQRELEDGKLENMSAEKIALMSQFGYEDDGEPEPGQGVGDAAATAPPTNNRDHAAATVRQEAERRRTATAGGPTKADARKETKQAKLDKAAKKDERRKKAGKRERQKM